jgi:hypothetical protein
MHGRPGKVQAGAPGRKLAVVNAELQDLWPAVAILRVTRNQY